jgi:hypothetical protein
MCIAITGALAIKRGALRDLILKITAEKKRMRWHLLHGNVRKLAGIGIIGLCFVSSAYSYDFLNGERPDKAGKQGAAQSKALKQETLKRVYQPSDIPLRITLDPPAPAEKAAMAPRKDQPLQIGFGREIPPAHVKPSLTWTALPDGGHTAVFTVTSPGARGMRLALVVPRMEKGVELRFFDAQSSPVNGPFTAKEVVRTPQKAGLDTKASAKGEGNMFWSPVIEGETVGVEIYLPASFDPDGFSISIPQVSHLVHSLEKDLSDIGTSGACNIDLACKSTAPPDLGDAVARIVFTKGGGTYLCTGTLLSDNEQDSVIPYFITANHCISSQVVADTINTYWFFERSSCGGPDPSSVVLRANGAELIRTGTKTDYTLLQLDDKPPAGVYYAGWQTAPLAETAKVIGIHHPAGDLKKWSRGGNMGFADWPSDVNGTGSHIQVIWSQGVTEGGSSGSGIFDIAGRFRGSLTGGISSCLAPDEPDWYGRFDLTYPSIKRWLYLHPATLSPGVAVDASVQQGDSKEYRIVASSTHTQLKVSLTNLTQNADLYVRRNRRPTLDSRHCRPNKAGTVSETCTLSNPGQRTYYIRVRGESAGSTTFRIKATLT